MKKLLLFVPFAALLASCGTKTNIESNSNVQSEETTITTTETTAAKDNIVENSKFTIAYPEDVTSGQKDKLDINDIYILHENDTYLLVCDYKYKNCWFDYPASFVHTYNESAYINGIEVPFYIGEIEDADAQAYSDVLSLSYADVKVGHTIKNYDKVKDGNITVIINLSGDKLKMYEITGKMSELRIEEKG